MAEQFSDEQERRVVPDESSIPATTSIPSRAASRLSILIAFIAGAFAAWLIISMNVFG